MFRRPRVRTVAAIPGAMFLALTLAGQALAFTWSSPTTFAGSDAWGGAALATLGGTNAVVQYETCDTNCTVYTRRTTNSGATWKPAIIMDAGGGTDGFQHSLAGMGVDVDSVQVFFDNSELHYEHSSDGGTSFGSALLLSSSAVGGVSVARGPGGVVAVAYESAAGISVRVSTTGGASFANAKTLSTSDDGFLPQAAVGDDGVIYVAWDTGGGLNGQYKIHMRHSTNSGTSWSAASTFASHVDDNAFSITASGTHAYLAYTVASGVVYKRTLNDGSSWSSAMNLSPTGKGAYLPVITLQNGVLRALYEIVYGSPSVHSVDYYRQSSNGTSWSSPKAIPSSDTPQGVGYSGKIIVLYGAQPKARTS